MSKKLGLLFASASLLSLAACTALLGSYEVGSQPGGNPEGGGSGDASDDVVVAETGPTDAASDGSEGGTLSLLKCSLSEMNARTIDTGPLTQLLHAFGLGTGGQTRVIASKAGQSGVVVYTFDRNSGGSAPQGVPFPNVGQVLSVRRLASGIGILSIATAPAPATGTSLGVTVIDDATGAASRTSFMLVNPTPQQQQTGAFALLGTDYLFAYGDGNGTIQAGRAIAGGNAMTATVATGVTGDSGRVKSVEIANGKMYIFNDVGPDPSNNNASSGYYVLDTNITNVSPLTSTASGTTGRGSFVVATDSTLGNFQVAAGEVDFNAPMGTPPAFLHAGPVPTAKATSFNVLDIPVAIAFDSLLDAPLGDHSSARFQGNDFIALGPNPSKGPGLEFVWFDTKNKVLRAVNNNANRLLPTRTVSAVAAIATQTTGVFANFDVVWIENATPDPANPTPAMLYDAQLSCFK